MPYEASINATHEYKHSMYQSLINDIDKNGFTVEYCPIERAWGSLNSKDNSIRFKKIHKAIGINIPYKQFNKTS